jgi:hypothetical protein
MAETGTNVNLLYEWLTDCDKENIILCFKGDFNQDLVNAIVMLTEQEPDIKSGPAVVRSRVFSVLVECMQNIRKYAAELSSGGDLKPGIVIVSFKEGAYTVSTGNFVTAAQVPDLEKRLSGLQKMGKEELKALHKKVLSQTELSSKSGAGLGLISIARKGDNIRYNFRTCEGGLSFYSLNVHIANQK